MQLKLDPGRERVGHEPLGQQGPVMRQSTIAKIEAAQRPVRVNEAVLLAAIFRVPLAELLQDPDQRDPQDTLTTARDIEREVMGELLQAAHRLEEHRAAHAAAAHAVDEAERRVEALRNRYAEAQATAAALAAHRGDESR